MRFTKPKKGGIELPTLNNPASAENVQSGFEVIGADGNKITGTHEEEPGLDTSDATATAANIDSGKTAYINGVKVTGTSNKVDTSDATATAANIDKGKTAYINNVKVAGTSTKVNTSDATATAADISNGKTAYGKPGKVTGTGFVQSNSKQETRTSSFTTRDKAHYCRLIVKGNPSNGTVHIEVSVGLDTYTDDRWYESLDYSI